VSVLKPYHPLAPQALEHAIDVNGCETEGITKLLLGNRQIELSIPGQTDALHPRVQLAHLMRNPRLGVAPPEIDQPGTQHCHVDERRPPEGLRELRPIARQFHQCITGQGGDRNGREGEDAMIHLFEDGNFAVTKVARNQEGDNLPCSITKGLIAGRPPIENRIDVRWRVTLAKNVTALVEGPGIAAYRFESLPIIGGQNGDRFEFGDEWYYHRRPSPRHPMLYVKIVWQQLRGEYPPCPAAIG